MGGMQGWGGHGARGDTGIGELQGQRDAGMGGLRGQRAHRDGGAVAGGSPNVWGQGWGLRVPAAALA